MVDELRGRRIDFMVGPTPKHTESDLDATFLYNNRIRVVVGIKSSWVRRRKVTLSDLIGEPWCVAPGDTAVGAVLAEALRVSGLPMPRVAFSSTSSYERRKWIAAGRSVGIMGEGTLYFAAETPPLKLLPIDLVAPPVGISITALKNRVIGPAAPLFIEAARAITAPLRDGRK
jgi:DNA-binding transcriptional LysR family regulator